MPKLPEQNKERDFELLDKSVYSRGTMDKFKPAAFKHHLKLPLRPIIGLVILVVVLGGIYTISKTYFPDLLKQKATQSEATAVEYPVNVDAISYPSDILKEKFLANFRSASAETDLDKKYKLLEDNFILLRGFYSANPEYANRVQLDSFTAYMKKNYPEQFEANKNLYNVLCIDKQCGEVKNPDEIVAIREEIVKEEVMNKQVKEAILRNFDAAGLNAKDQQANFYLSAYSMLVSESKRTKDADIKSIATKFFDFIVKDFPEVTIPENLKP